MARVVEDLECVMWNSIDTSQHWHDGTRRGRNGHRERARSGGVRLLPQIEGIFRTVGGA